MKQKFPRNTGASLRGMAMHMLDGGVATADQLSAIQGANTFDLETATKSANLRDGVALNTGVVQPAMPTAPAAAPSPWATRSDGSTRSARGQALMGALTGTATQEQEFSPLKVPAPVGFENGGEISPWSLRGIMKMVTPKTSNERYAEYEAAKAKAAQAAQQTPEQQKPVTAPTQGISGYVGNGALERRMKEAGLRDGGTLRTGQGGLVPGTGTGDKIPAKYEPGEFVVSNDMLDAAPGLREQLHGLRREVLADKGMTPAQADAGALRGGAMHALNGIEWTTQDLQGARPRPKTFSPVIDRVVDNLRTPQAPIAPQVSPEVQWARQQAAARAAARLTTPAPAPAPSVLAQPTPAPASTLGRVKNAATAIGNGAKSIASGSVLDADVGAAAGRVLQGAKSLAGGLTSGIGRLAQPIALGMTANQVANTPTETYANRVGTDFNGDELSSKALGLRAVGALADLGDTVTGGLATKTGNWLAGNGFNDNNADGTAPTVTPEENIRGGEKIITQPAAQTAQPAAQTAQPAAPAIDPSLRGVTNAEWHAGIAASEAALGNRVKGSMDAYSAVKDSLRRMQDPNNPALFNKGKQLLGSRVRVSTNARGGIELSDRGSEGTPMPYTDRNGNPTRDWGQTQNYAEAMQRAQALRDKIAERDATTKSPGEDRYSYKARLDAYNKKQDRQSNMDIATAPARFATQQRQRAGEIIDAYGKNKEGAVAQLAREGLMDYAKNLSGLMTDETRRETSRQTTEQNAEEQTRKALGVYTRDEKTGRREEDPGLSAEQYDTAMMIIPGIATMQPGDRNRAISTARPMIDLMARLNRQTQVGMAAANPFSIKAPKYSDLPKLNNASYAQLTGIDGPLTWGGENGDYTLEYGDGRKQNLGKDLDSKQLAMLKLATKGFSWADIYRMLLRGELDGNTKK